MYTSVGASVSCFASTGSKVGFGVTLLRLTSGWYRAFVWFAVVTLTVVMLPSATMTWLKCTPVQKNFNRQMEGTCWDESVTLNYGIFNAAWCAFMDFVLALVPWKIIWGMRLRRHEKLGVCFAMSLGWLAGVCAIIKGVYLVQLEQGDFFLLRVFIKEKASTLGYDKKKNNNNNSNQNSEDIELNTYRSVIRPAVDTGTVGMQESKGDSATGNEKLENDIPVQEMKDTQKDITQAKPIDLESQPFDRTEVVANSHEQLMYDNIRSALLVSRD
ncbi:hypothetical protein ColLi_03149 [Colletotrichum liriopes]|uniref:Rhodopsin domain-containing protein n=1 Tax=Colletotrichum liriopes TaxID=708192 RepID=A0AA37GG41_9PEZI|nr:hypothetical protein ColLi_03149 [Colletotrichum liriopes]